MKIGRNQLCPCGSGLKYKKCCLNKTKEENYCFGFYDKEVQLCHRKYHFEK